jgi:predicted DNA-binding WGR domain protein
MHRLEYTAGTSNKFWMAEVNGSTLVVHFGRIGTQGQVQVKAFASNHGAKAERDRRLTEKRNKGYREVTYSAQDAQKLAGYQASMPAGSQQVVEIKQPGFWARLFGAKPEVITKVIAASVCSCAYCEFILSPAAVRCDNCGAKVTAKKAA